jgi:hypothetical protein
MKQPRQTTLIIPLVLAAALLFACAAPNEGNQELVKDVIKTIDGEPVVPRTANRLYLAKIKNFTGNELLAGKLAIKLKETVNADGRLVAVKDKESADLALEVALKEYTIQDMEFDAAGQVTSKRMKITASARLVNLAKKSQVFYDPLIQAFTNYSEFIPPIKEEMGVIDEVTAELAKRITAKTLSGWYTQYMTPAEKGHK